MMMMLEHFPEGKQKTFIPNNEMFNEIRFSK